MSVPIVTEKFLPKGDDHKRRHHSQSRSSEDKHHKKDKPKKIDTLIITESTIGIIVPDNADFAEVLLVGGGGGGGASGRNVINIPQFGGGGGGGGGTYITNKLSLGGGTLDVKIGAGGLLGSNAGMNGQDGGDTILTYGHHNKIAHGGMGGLGSFNGSLGGKGGKGGGKGEDGDDGFTNINSLVPNGNLQGGNGGLSGLCNPTTYGNGGKGEDQPPVESVTILAVPAVFHLPETKEVTPFKMPSFIRGGGVTPSLVFNKGPFGSVTFIPHAGTMDVSPATSTRATIITEPATVDPFIIPTSAAPACVSAAPACNTSCSTITSTSCSTSPVVYNTSNDGIPGYCKIVFYSYCDSKPKSCKNINYSRVTIKDPLSLYLINPNASTVEVDTTNHMARLSLGRPCKKYKKITIKLLHQNGLSAFLQPVTGGTFLLSSANPIVTLIYEHCTWNILDNLENILSYYPTVKKGSNIIPYDAVPPPGTSTPQIAVSADGETFAFGEPNDDNSIGAVWIYVKRDCRWARRAKLVGNDYVGTNIYQGSDVSLSADGKTVVFGGYGDNGGTGAAWVFQCINGDWIQQGPKLVNSTSDTTSGLGYSVDISADGNTIIVGETYNPIVGAGNGVLFTRTAGVWSLNTNLVGSLNSPAYYQGISVSISADGNTVVLGSIADVIWIFTKDLITGIWSQDGPPFTGPSGTYFGTSVSLSANGLRLAVGLPFYNSFQGGVAILNKVGGLWLQDGFPFYYPYSDPVTYQGLAVKLSADGNTLAFTGNTTSGPNEGILWVYIYQDQNWMPAQKLINGVPTDYMLVGIDVDMSSDASTTVAATYPLPGEFGYAIVYE